MKEQSKLDEKEMMHCSWTTTCLMWNCVLRDRWRNLIDRFNPSKNGLKNTGPMCKVTTFLSGVAFYDVAVASFSLANMKLPFSPQAFDRV